MDETEQFRREQVAAINGAVQPDNRTAERIRLEEIHGSHNVWDTNELKQEFDVLNFAAPYCFVMRKSDGIRGSVQFQHTPRFYFDFKTK